MKRLLLLLALCLLLSACTPQTAPEAAPEMQGSQTREPEPASLSEAASVDAYVFSTWTESVLVDGEGQVRLRLPAGDGNLQLVRETGSGQPKCCAAWLAVGAKDDGFGGLIPASYTTAVYDLEGRLLLELEEQATVCAAGSVFWYQADSGCAVHSLDGGGMLLDGLTSVFDLGSRLAVVDRETGTRLTFLDLNGRPEEERTIPEQYQYKPRTVWNGKRYVGLNYTDGTCAILEESGNLLLNRYEGTVSFSKGCAIVERAGTYRCIDLESGELLLESREPVCELLGESVLQCGEDGFLFLRNLQGQRLFSEPICRYAASDTDGNGWPDLLLAETTARTVMLRADGTVLCECPFDVSGTVLLTNGKAVGSVLLEKAVLLDAETGTQEVLREGVRMCEIRQLAETPGFLVWYSNGETAAYDVYAEDGTRRLEGLSDAREAGPGIIQCTKDGQTGLMRLDGTWLYAVPAAEAAVPTLLDLMEPVEISDRPFDDLERIRTILASWLGREELQEAVLTARQDESGLVTVTFRSGEGGILPTAVAALIVNPESGEVTPRFYAGRVQGDFAAETELCILEHGSMCWTVPGAETDHFFSAEADWAADFHGEALFGCRIPTRLEDAGQVVYLYRKDRENMDSASYPDWAVSAADASGREIGRDIRYVYYLWEPTDVQFDLEDPQERSLYDETTAKAVWLADGFLLENGLTANPHWFGELHSTHSRECLRVLMNEIQVSAEQVLLTLPAFDTEAELEPWHLAIRGQRVLADGTVEQVELLAPRGGWQDGMTYAFSLDGLQNMTLTAAFSDELPITLHLQPVADETTHILEPDAS